MNILPSRKRQQSFESMGWPLTLFRGEVDRLFDQFFGGASPRSAESSTAFSSWYPSLDVAESDTEVTLKVEVPGLNPKDVELSLSGNMLTVQGEKREESEEKEKDYYVSERRFGSFRRTIELPDTIDPESINAEQRDGILTVRLKKTKGGSKKRIPVTTAK